VVAGNTYAGGTLAASASNACGTGFERTKNLQLNPPPTPGTISGISNGLCMLQGITYSITPVQGAGGYTWVLPNGVSAIGGMNSTSIGVNFGPSFSSGNISVTALNACGTSAARTLALTAIPGRPGPISGPLQLCAGAQNQPYGVSTVNGATSYNWQVFTGASIASGQGTKNITVNIPSTTSSSNNISVSASNSCGTGQVRSLGGITVDPAYCSRLMKPDGKNRIAVYPNPSSGLINLRAEGETPVLVVLYNLLGELVHSSTWRNELALSGLPNGLYILRAQYKNGENSILRIEKQD
jgi:hypothetical protein